MSRPDHMQSIVRQRPACIYFCQAVAGLVIFGLSCQGAAAQQPDPLTSSIAAHGGAPVQAATTLRIEAQSTANGVTRPVTISASLDGSIRLDYQGANPHSYVNTPSGAIEIVLGHHIIKSGHIGAFAQMDMLSVFGIRHLAQPDVQRITQSPSTVDGRSTLPVRAITGRTQTHYRRTIADDVTVQVDQATGLVAEIMRRQYAEKSLDISFLAGFRFSDYRSVNGVLLPFRIDRVMDGLVRETITVQTVDLNPSLASDLFRR